MKGIRQYGESRLSRLHVSPRPVKRVVHRAVLVHQFENVIQVFRPNLIRVNHQVVQPLEFRLRGLSANPEQRQRHVPLAQVLAHGFSDSLRIAHVIEGVIDQLKSVSDLDAELMDRVRNRGRAVRDQSADAATRGNEGRRLAVDDVEIFLFGELQVVHVDQLEHFPLGEQGAGLAHGLDDPQIGVRGHERETLGEEEIARQDARLVVPFRIGGRVAPPHLRIIHHVVVQKRSRVDIFHHATQRRGAGPPVTARLGDEHQEHRPNPLAAGTNEIITHIGYQNDVRMKIRVNRLFHFLHLGSD